MSIGLREIAIKLINGELPAIAAEDLKVERLKICNSCQHFSKLRQCKLCGCWMDLKVKLLAAECPANKW